MKSFRMRSLGFKIGLLIVVVETLALALLGQYYIRRFGREVDEKLRQSLEKPGALMQVGLLNLGTISDRSAMSRLIGPSLVDALIVGANGNIFHAMDATKLGRAYAGAPVLGEDWIVRARKGPFVVESREGAETFLTRVSSIGVGEGHAPFLFAIVKVRTTESMAEKAALRRQFILGSVAAIVATSLTLLACLRLLVTRRLDRIALTVQAMADGNLSARIGDHPSGDEVGKIQDGVDRMADRLQVSMTSLENSLGALRTSEQRYRAVVISVPVVIFSLDRDGIFTLSEGLGLQSLGLKPGQVVGQSVYTIYRESPEIISSVERALKGEAHQQEVAVAGRVFETWYGPLMNERGDIEGVIGVASDVTARKQGEEERVRLERQVMHVQKLESLGVMAGGIAHDFNNILTAVLGHAELARMIEPPDAPVQEHLDEIQMAARRAADLARQMLAYSGKGRFEVQRIDVNEAVREMVGLLSASVSKRIALRTDLAEQLPAVSGDDTQLRQVILNLITNAAEAIGDRNGVVTIRTRLVEDGNPCPGGICAQVPARGEWEPEPGTQVAIEVADDGCGMDAGTIERMCEPFFTTKFTGRGLGLAVVMGIMRGHRGAMRIASEPGRGSTFTVLFPAEQGEWGGDNMAKSLATETGGWHGSGTILLVDDEEQVRVLGTHMLKLLGFDTKLAEDGIAATELFAKDPALYRCVILDWNMPRRGGAETCRELRRIRPGVPVLLSSGYAEQELKSEFTAEECPFFLKKPFTLGELTERLRAALVP